MLARKDREGFVRGTIGTLARDAGMTREECSEAMVVLESPDPESQCREWEGRRVRAVAGGWEVLNHYRYRDMVAKQAMRASQAEYQRGYRERKKKERVERERAAAVSGSSGGNEPGEPGLRADVAAWLTGKENEKD